MFSSRVLAARAAVKLLGGPVSAAKRLGIPNYQTVQSWEANGVPAVHCMAVERLLDGAVTRTQLRPDDWHRYWPELGDSASTPLKAVASQTYAATESIAEEGVHA